MRIATLGISHETNTFSRVPAEYDKFVQVELLRGAEIIERHGDSNYTIAGYLEASRELGFELVPLMFARTGPIGTITKDAYDRLSGEMLGMLRDQGPWDAALIAVPPSQKSSRTWTPSSPAPYVKSSARTSLSASRSTCTPTSRVS